MFYKIDIKISGFYEVLDENCRRYTSINSYFWINEQFNNIFLKLKTYEILILLKEFFTQTMYIYYFFRFILLQIKHQAINLKYQ